MTILLADYNRDVEGTDKLPKYDLRPVLFGLFGEVGSIMAVAKKHYRESDAFTDYQAQVDEELGDTLWYLAALARRLGIDLQGVFEDVRGTEEGRHAIAATDLVDGALADVTIVSDRPELEKTLLDLGGATAALSAAVESGQQISETLADFASLYLRVLRATGMPFAQVVRSNVRKVVGRFGKADRAQLPNFDRNFPLDEQIPAEFEIQIVQRTNGRCYLRWNGVFLGDPLTDNIADPDGYRFHDVFHFAYAAILNWSPVFRALIKHKRKSDPSVDEAQDGGRAIVVEEGLTAWIFSRAKQYSFFEGRTTLSFDLLKTVQQFVSGYEVETCPLNLWEEAILEGYRVFRQVRINNGGRVIADRLKRKVVYKSI